MNRNNFYENQDVGNFVEWLSKSLEQLAIDLKIGISAKVPYGVNSNLIGINSVIEKYQWQASWSDLDSASAVSSCDWDSTARSLSLLSEKIKKSIYLNDDQKAFEVCSNILKWGGERNPKTGARKFLTEKLNNGQLIAYLSNAKQTFNLEKASLNQLESIQLVNSMMTKIYALNSDDGLPIYDTRVAAAIAGLVEIFRQRTSQDWQSVPELLAFPVPPEDAKSERRRLKYLDANSLVPKPELLNYSSPNTISRWASAKIRLGWIIQLTLERNSNLLTNQMHSRQHAFEAALFMIGYDIRSLFKNI